MTDPEAEARLSMDAERWRRISALYHAAMAHAGPMRAAFLAQSCADDDSLRREVENLLDTFAKDVLTRPDRVRAIVDVALQQQPQDRFDFLRTVCGDDGPLLTEATGLLEHDHSRLLGTSRREADGSTNIETQSGVERTLVPPREAAEFRGNDRFLLQRRIGSGGFGVVYEARDRVKDTIVALKTLPNVTSESLYRFKREFRSLADVSHRNLVQLYELVSHENRWFFTMELVDGRHFLEHVSDNGGARHGAAVASVSGMTPVLVGRLVPALRQLIDGLSALHRSGHVHRDVKPSNVLVTSDGRVVLLDFGLVLDAERDDSFQSLMIAGTPAFMSPEQAAGLPLTPASDWYSVGVMLFQALTGAVPFPGTYLQILTDKQRTDPPSPSSLVEGIPSHLETLCLNLLDRDATRRPSEDEILDCLDSARWRSVEGPRTHRRPRAASQPFVGRERHLDTLNEAFRQMRSGVPTLAAVSGPSGIGKSALVRAFLDGIGRNAPEAAILTGRCYERESVPYKALDSFVDSLARYLRRLPAHETRALLPRDTSSMAQLFPVMRDFHAGLPHRVVVPLDVQEVRRRACAALRDVLGRLGDTHPLVVFIDDLQWGDVDSATLLADVMRPPDAPVLLLVAVYRDVEIQTSPFLRSFLEDDATKAQSFVRVRVDPLSTEESQELAAALTSRLTATQDISVIAAESGGSPFFIGELVRFAEAAGGVSSDASISGSAADSDEREATLAHVMQIRISRLPTLAQRLLQMVSVNGRPMPEQILKSLGGAGVSGNEAALALLRSEHLLRARDTAHGAEFESYHDRIREIVVSTLDPRELRECHRQLAAAWEGAPVADAELLAAHLLGAGEAARAAHYTSIAAAEAERALAFDRAARLYERALDLLAPTSGQRGALMVRFAIALTNAGRSAEAAAVYLAAPTSSMAEALDFKQKAAQQLLFAGHLDDGLRVIREVLRTIGMTLPETPRQALLALMGSRLRVRLRGLRYRERAASAVASGLLTKVDACWAVSAGLSVVDTMRGAVFQARHLLLALRAGEIERVHRALCLEAGFAAAGGSRTVRRVRRIRSMTADLARRIGTPYASAMHLLVEGVSDYLCGRWKPATAALADAERLLTNDCTGVTWELDSSRLFGLWSRYYLGEFKAIGARFPVLLKDAYDRGDLYASTTIGGLYAHIVYLAAADPETASRHTREAIAKWPQGGFDLAHFMELWSSTDIAIYERRGMHAWTKLNQTWPSLRRSLLMEVQMHRVSMLDLRGRAALSAADESRQPSHRDDFLRIALGCAKAMERQRVGWASAMALMLRAGVSQCRGRDDPAALLFDRAHDALLTLDMRLLAMVARRRHGELVGGDAGLAEIRDSDLWMGSQGIRDPASLARMFAPWSARAG